MTEREKGFRSLMLKIGIAMLVFVASFEVLVSIYFIAEGIIATTVLEPTATVISQLLYGFIYAAAFTVPAIVLAQITKKDKQPLIKKMKLPRQTVLYIISGIAAILSFAYLNSLIVDIFNYSDFAADTMWQADYDEIHEVLLQLLTTAVAPGIFEELLFRGVVLAKLRPYGKVPAILISAVLFGLMHQNSGQFLYAMAAGILLGWIALETESLLCCMLIHFSNNAFSVLEQAVLANLPETTASVICYTAEILLFAGAIVCACVLMRGYYKKSRAENNALSDGIFEKQVTLGADEAKPPKRWVRLAFSPTVIAFTVISMSSALVLIFSSIFYSTV